MAWERPRIPSTSSSPKPRENSSTIYLKHLESGLILSEDIRTKKGRLLFSSGAPLTGVVIEKIKSYADLGEIEDAFRIHG